MRLLVGLYCIALFGTAACGKKAVEIDPGAADEMASRWNGRLTTPSGMSGIVQIQGSSWMGADGNRTHAKIFIDNATPGGEHPWHVHRGGCGSGGEILGEARAYPVLKVDGDGKDTKEVRLEVPFPTYGDYHVNVHASASNMQTVIACSNLAAPTRR